LGQALRHVQPLLPALVAVRIGMLSASSGAAYMHF
jgi:hypothetical protein